MQKDRREKYQSGTIQKRYREIEIAIRAYRSVEMKDESREAQRGEMEHKRRASALFEKNKETNDQINDADQIDVEISRLPLVKISEVIEVGPVGAGFVVRRSFHEVVQLAVDTSLIEIDLNVAGKPDFLGPAAVEADPNQTVARQQPRPFRGGASLDRLGDDAVGGVDPFNAVPGRGFMTGALAEVEQASTNQ